MNNYLFLDIDGVLNSEEYAIKINNLVLSSWIKHAIEADEDYNPWFDPSSVAVLRTIQERYNFKIVISSTWRYHLSVADFNKLFLKYYNWDTNGIIIGKTDTGSGIRGTQIKRWLDSYGKYPYNYLIVDDSSDMLDTQKQFFLHVSLLDGLKEKHLEDVFKILGDPNEYFKS